MFEAFTLNQAFFHSNDIVHTAVVDDLDLKVSLPWPKVIEGANTIATLLASEKSIRVAVILKNSAAYVPVFLGVAFSRNQNALISPKLSADEIATVIRKLDCKVAVVDMHDSALQKEAARGCPHIMTVHYDSTGDFHATLNTPLPPAALQQPSPDDVCLLLQTSGTTREPKTVGLSHKNLVSSFCNIARTYQWGPSVEEGGLLVMPLFHVHGLIAGCFSPLFAGSRVIFCSGHGFHKTTFWSDVVASKATWTTMVPSMLQILVNAATESIDSRLRFIRVGSSILPTEVARKAESLFKTQVLEAYAMTETSQQMAANKPGQRQLGIVGWPLGTEILAVNAATGKIEAEGELCVRGPNVISAYLDSEEINAESFYESLPDYKGPDESRSMVHPDALPERFGPEFLKIWWDVKHQDRNWLRTGDIGRISPDGGIRLLGRSKEFINRGGEKIGPGEIEDLILQECGELIREVAAFPYPDEILGEVVAVLVVPAGEPSKSVTDGIKKAVASKMAPFKVPQHVFQAESIPKGPTGKILRLKLRQHVSNPTNAKEFV